MKLKQEQVKKSEFGHFIELNKKAIFILTVILIIAYGMKVFHLAISHDTEAIINVPTSLYQSWLSMGRFGLVAIKYLLELEVFNPYIASVFMFITMIINAVVWEYLFWKLTERKENFSKRSWIFPALFFTALIMAEQQVFLLQAFEVELAILLVGIALLAFWNAIETKKKYYWIFIVCPLIIAFSCYQAMIPLFIAGAVASFILKNERNQAGWKEIFQLIAGFVLSFFLYEIINKIIMYFMGISPTSYISDQVLWGQESVWQCIKNILKHVLDVITVNDIYYSVLFSISVILTILFFVQKRKKGIKKYYLYVLANLVLLATPFFMTILLGQKPTYRTQIVLPFVYGFIIQYAVGHIALKSSIKTSRCLVAANIIVLIFALQQSTAVSRMYYTEYVQYEEDVRLATKISDRIDQLNLGEIPEEPVVFIGSRSPQLNLSSCREYEIPGHSFFEWAFSTQYGTFIMRNFMATIGYNYNAPSTEDVVLAEQYAETMESWPNTGSVQVVDGIIIVKLSDI